MYVIQFQSVRALINDFKYGAFAYKAAHIFFTDSKYACACNPCSPNLNNQLTFEFPIQNILFTIEEKIFIIFLLRL